MKENLEPVTGNGDMIQFYKELFRFNALLDIAIDEEEFVPGEDNNIQIIEEKWNKVFQKQEKTWKFSDFEKIFQTSKEEHFDLQLQDIWENFKEELDSEIAPQRILRKKGTGLLLLAKYMRALQLADPLQEDLSTKQDTLTSFVSANLSHLYTTSANLTKESTYLQTLLLLECAACASGEATIGFLKLAESATGRTGNGNVKDGEEEFEILIPYFKALVEYNKAVAFSHTERKEDALDSSVEVIKLLRLKCLGEKEKTRKPCTKLKRADENNINAIKPITEEELRRYLEIPALHLKADLLSKMQCCFNAIETLQELLKKVKPDGKNSYKNVRARLLEIPCWLDMGDFQSAEQVVSELLTRVEKLLPFKLKEELKRCANKCDNEPKKWNTADLKEWLKCLPTLRTDAIKLILQWDQERWKEETRKIINTNEVINEDLISEAEDYIKNLKAFIETYKGDRFQRQNLKALAVDWLESFAYIKRVDKEHSISSKGWRKGIEAILDCLDLSLGNESSHIENEGDIANEIWGKSFKRFDSSLVERLLRILSKLTDHSEDYFHTANSSSDNNKRIFLKTLSEFEMRVLGLVDNDEKPPAFFSEIEEGILPREGDFWCRHAMRRGWVLKRYIKFAKNNDVLEIEELVWLEREANSTENGKTRGIGECLKRLFNSWNNLDSEKKQTELNATSQLRLEDYKRIIGDSDFLKHLQSGRSEHPINLFVNSDKEKLTGVEFVALRRWNSHTPEISFSKGGGYFVFIPKDSNTGDKDNEQQCGIFRATKLGIVVDPGFDFIHNFFSQGFTLDDIDLILITHADADHINDYAGLADLFRVRSKPGKDSKKIYTFIPRNAHKILERYITYESYRRLYYDTVLVDVDVKENLPEKEKVSFSLKLPSENGSSHPRIIIGENEVKCDGPCLKIECVPASHDDHAGKRPGSFGYVLTFSEKHRETGEGETEKTDVVGTIGFTGDSQWFPEYAEAFEKCDLVCSHIGSVLGDEVDDYEKQQHLGDWEDLIRKKNHPYLPGEVLFLEQLRKLKESPEERIVVLSEFGEELKGLIRKDICERLNRCMSLDSDGCWSNFIIHDKNSEKGKDYCCWSFVEWYDEWKKNWEEKDRCKECEDNRKNKRIRTIPADVGLRISIRNEEKPMVHCVMCERFHDPEDMEWIPHGSEEAMFYVCGPCYRSKSRDIRVAKYESILDSGRPVQRSHGSPEAGKGGDNN